MTEPNTSLAVIGLPAFADNYLWIIQRGRYAAVVDPGTASPVIEYLDRTQSTLSAILVTHHHGDHTGGISGLLQRFSAPVFGPRHESIPRRSRPLVGGEAIGVPMLDLSLDVIFTPGHTRAAVSYLGAGMLFCGDTLFAGGCGRLFEGTPIQMHTSLQVLASLPPETRVYCAHEYTVANLQFATAAEPDNEALSARLESAVKQRRAGLPTVPSTIAEELATNPFLRTQMPQVRKAAEKYCGTSCGEAVDVFAALRTWKNVFRGT